MWRRVRRRTYNFVNPYTQYRSGIDAHLDWAISPYLTEKLHTALGGFRSRVAGAGPQIGFFFPVADRDGYLNLRGYYEFDAKNRLEGWTAYVTFSVEAAERKPGEPRPARPSRFRADVGRRAPRRLSSSQSDRDADQRRTEGDHRRPVAHGRNPAYRPNA
jgi:hypothetical protein